MMRCHYIYDKGEKILIPGCGTGDYIDKIEDCVCDKRPVTWAGFERKAFKEQVEKMKAHISELELLVENLQDKLKRRYL